MSRRELAPLLVLPALVVALTWGAWRHGPPQWKPDALFYQAQVEELRGLGRRSALDKVFGGPLAAPRRESETVLPASERKVSSPAWVSYSSQFYRRRWVVPALAAAITPAFHTRSLQVVSLAAYALAGVLFYALLRRRFSRLSSLAAAAVCVLLPAFRYWSEQPLSDSFGVLLETAALVSAVLVSDRGLRWLPLWIGAVAALSLTRDAAVVVVAAAAWMALRQRSRETAALAATGAIAAVPAPLVFGAPLRVSMAYTLNGFTPPADPSWHFVAHHFLSGLHSLEKNDVSYALHHPGTTAAALAGLVALFAVRRRGDAYFSLMRAAAVACFGFVGILPNYTAFRLELVFLPVVAVGLALTIEALARRGLALAP